MYFRSGHLPGSKKGVSEVMGALLLIVVVVVAVASLAAFISIAEKNAQSRSNYITGLANENLQVTFAQFRSNATRSAHSNPLIWNNVTLTIRNTNTASSELDQIKAGSYWFVHWNQLDSTSRRVMVNHTSGKGLLYGGSGPSLLIPAKATLDVLLNFTANGQIAPPRNSSITVTLLTASGKFFTSVFNPPTAVGEVGLTTLNEQYFNRDVMTLDGRSSSGTNGSQIISYLWTIEVPQIRGSGLADCNNTAFSYANHRHYFNATLQGVDTQFLPENYAPLISPSTSYCITGPFRVTLTVVDTLGFISNASAILTPIDSNLAPTASVSATISSNVITGTVLTALGTAPYTNAVVFVSYSGNTTAISIPLVGQANAGTFRDNVGPLGICPGTTFKISLGTLPSVSVTC